MATFTTQTLAEALPNFGRRSEITAPKAHAAHLAHEAEIARIRRQHAEARKSAPGYSVALGCFTAPKDAVAFVDAQLDAARGASALQMAAEAA